MGAIADVIKNHHPDCPLTIVELESTFIPKLRDKHGAVFQADFLTITGAWDRIVANPPFTKGLDVEHVLHMYDCLAAGGILVSVKSPSWQWKDDSRSASFRDWLQSKQSYTEELPEGTFEESGTMIATVIIAISKPGR